MDIATITTLISTVGFPIAAAIGVGFILYKVIGNIREDHEKTITQLIQANQQLEQNFSKKLDAFDQTMKRFNETLIRIDTRLESVESKVDGLTY